MCVSRDTARDIMMSAWRLGYAKADTHNWFLVDLHLADQETELPWKRGECSCAWLVWF